MANKLLLPSRRGFLSQLAGLVAAPAVVKAASLMPVKSIEPILIGIDYGLEDETWGQIIRIRLPNDFAVQHLPPYLNTSVTDYCATQREIEILAYLKLEDRN